MRCRRCGTENPDDASFCYHCGTALPAPCVRCGAELPEGSAFCPRCGHEVGTPVAEGGGLRRFMPEELLTKLERAAEGGFDGERRRVTMLFCDVEGSTAAAEHLDPEEWAEVMNGAFEHLIAPIYRYEGTLARLMGDAVLAFFGAPISHEDDPERAVRAGLEILSEIEGYRQQVRREWGFDLNVRVGINTGLVVVGAVGSDLRVEYTAMGDAVNVAARMEQTAEPGTVQVSSATRRLVDKLFEFEDLGDLEVKGRAEPVGGHRVVRALRRPAVVRGVESLRAPLIGREAELEQLREAVTALTTAGSGGVVSVMGEAGLGKSRLVSELREMLEASGELARLEWSEGRTLSYETARPLAPVRDLVRRLARITEADTGADGYERIESLTRRAAPGRVGDLAPFLATLVDVEVPEEERERIGFFEAERLRAETFAAVVAVLEGLAHQRPLVVVLEDLHWADSSTVDLAGALLELVERAPLLLICAFRPRREDPSWAVHELADREHPHRHTTIELTPLDPDATQTLLDALLGIEALPDAVRSTILEKAEGNPYFVEEVLRSLIDRGTITRDGEGWTATADVADLDVPDALSALITTRLDRLDERSREVVQAASVLGRELRYDELVALLGDVAHLDASLVDLQRREFLREVARLPKRRFRFKHALLQEAIYETVLLKTRAQLHATAADFLERLQPERVEDIAEHLLRGRQVERAIPYLVAAGERALAAHSLPEAARRMERALELLGETEDGALLRRALEGLGRAKEHAFDFEGAIAVYERLRDEGDRRGDTSMWISGQAKLALVTGVVFGRRDEAVAVLGEAERAARGALDEEGLVEACITQCYVRTAAAEFDQVERYMREVAELGERLEDTEAYLFGLSHRAHALVFLTRFDEALIRAEIALGKAEELGHLRYQAELLTFTIPTCHLRNGDLPQAVAALERGMEIAQRIGERAAEVDAATAQGKLALGRGELEDALASFRRAIAAADATGLPFLRALGRCVTGTCYLRIGGPMLQRALDLHAETLELMGMPMGTALGTQVWAELALCALEAGRIERAAELADKALHEPTMLMHLMRPHALLAACRVALAQGRLDDARGLAEEMESYVAERQMRNHDVTTAMARALVAQATGDHAQAVQHSERWAEVASRQGFKRELLDAHALMAQSLEALGRHAEAEDSRAAAEAAMQEIAAGFDDPALRTAFLSGSRALVRAHPQLER